MFSVAVASKELKQIETVRNVEIIVDWNFSKILLFSSYNFCIYHSSREFKKKKIKKISNAHNVNIDVKVNRR